MNKKRGDYMTFQEALNSIIDALPDVEKFDEQLTVLRGGNPDVTSSDGEDWEKKYKELQSVYRERFKEFVNQQNTVIEEKDDEKDDEVEDDEEITVEDLDFSAESE